MSSPCDKCYLNSKFLHKDLPFGCFSAWCDLNEDEGEKVLDVDAMKRVHKEWTKNHPGYLGEPHIRFWYYCRDPKTFEEFLKMYPDADHAPNDSWKNMYDIITLG